MDHELIERKYASFKKGVEEALRKFTSDIGDNVRGMREEINEMKQDIKKNKRLECVKCKDKFTSRETFDQLKVKVDSLVGAEDNLIELRNELNDFKIEVTKQNIGKAEPKHINVNENRNNIKIENEIENMKKEKVNNEIKIKAIDKRIESLQTENEKIKKTLENTKETKITQTNVSNNCSYCELQCKNGYELENHLVSNHKKEKKHGCDKCEAKFVSKWRLSLHMKVHQNLQIRKCHFFNNGLTCPFQKDGCKFAHVISNNCRFGNSCQRTKCQYRH